MSRYTIVPDFRLSLFVLILVKLPWKVRKMFQRLNHVGRRQIPSELYEKRDPYQGPDHDEPRPCCREHAIRISLDLLRFSLSLPAFTRKGLLSHQDLVFRGQIVETRAGATVQAATVIFPRGGSSYQGPGRGPLFFFDFYLYQQGYLILQSALTSLPLLLYKPIFISLFICFYNKE